MHLITMKCSDVKARKVGLKYLKYKQSAINTTISYGPWKLGVVWWATEISLDLHWPCSCGVYIKSYDFVVFDISFCYSITTKHFIKLRLLVLEILWPKNGIKLHGRHILATTPETKIAVSQKLIKWLGSNFGFILTTLMGTFDGKMKKIRDQSAWGIRWFDVKWPFLIC